MARPQKATVDYFPHVCKHSKTMFILEEKFGNDGYAFWFKLLEILGSTEGHVYDVGNPVNMMFLTSKTHVSEDIANDILDTLVLTGSIDGELRENGLIWSDRFVKNLSEVYKKRKVDLPQKPVIEGRNPAEEEFPTRKPELVEVSVVDNPQSKVKYTKVKYTKHIVEIISYLNTLSGKNFKPESKNTQKLISGRLAEGYTVDQFKKVIDTKVTEWGNDPKMEQYLRPDTLFRPSNFESYLNQKSKVAKIDSVNQIGIDFTKYREN